MQSVAKIRAGNTSPEAFANLCREWGNRSHSFRASGLARLYDLALTATGPILECGSGVSSIVLGLAAERSGVPIISLEDAPEWAERLQSALYALDIKTVSIALCGLSDGFYRLPADLPADFGLVFVDGPQVLDGRGQAYRLLADRMTGAIVIADDTRFRAIGRPFDLWALASGRIAERCGNYAIARAA